MERSFRAHVRAPRPNNFRPSVEAMEGRFAPGDAVMSTLFGAAPLAAVLPMTDVFSERSPSSETRLGLEDLVTKVNAVDSCCVSSLDDIFNTVCWLKKSAVLDELGLESLPPVSRGQELWGTMAAERAPQTASFTSERESLQDEATRDKQSTETDEHPAEPWCRNSNFTLKDNEVHTLIGNSGSREKDITITNGGPGAIKVTIWEGDPVNKKPGEQSYEIIVYPEGPPFNTVLSPYSKVTVQKAPDTGHEAKVTFENCTILEDER